MATDATSTALALKYDAMSAMCKTMEAEIERLLRLVSEKDGFIAAGLLREKGARDKNLKLSAENTELLRGQLKIMTDHEEFMKEIIEKLDGDESAESTDGECSEVADRTSLKRRRP